MTIAGLFELLPVALTIAGLFELLPVALAIAAAITCSIAYKAATDRVARIVLVLGIICAALLIVAQTSWWGSLVLAGSLEGTAWANWIWTVFNSTVMLSFIVYSVSVRNGGHA